MTTNDTRTQLPTRPGQMILVTEYGGLYDAAKPIPAYIHGGDWYRVDGEPWPGNDGYREGPAHEITGWEPLDLAGFLARNAEPTTVTAEQIAQELAQTTALTGQDAKHIAKAAVTLATTVSAEQLEKAASVHDTYGLTRADAVDLITDALRAAGIRSEGDPA